MIYGESFGTRLAILLAVGIASVLNISVYPQSTSAEKPKIKEFGSSLRKFEKKGKDNSKENKKQNNIAEEETIRIKTDLVVSDVLVVNQKGNAILGLKQSDFIVTENGVPQEMSIFSFGENAAIPRSIVLIIDYSLSQAPFIKNSIEAAKHLVDKLKPQDRMAIVTDDVKLLVDFTKDKALLKNHLDSLHKKALTKDSGRTEQLTALIATLNEMFDEEDIRPIVILQSDGDELFALKTPKTDEKIPPSFNSMVFGIPQKNYSLEDVYSIVSKSRATIYSIIPGFRFIGLPQEQQLEKMQIMEGEFIALIYKLWNYKRKKLSKEALIWHSNWYLKQQSALFEIAKLSGGYTDFIEKPEDAENVYSTIFTVINNRYVIGYYPTNEERDGKRRNVKIEVRNHPEYIVMGRKTYFVSEEKH